MSNTLYDQDFFAWANEQAQLLRSGKLTEADIDHIAEKNRRPEPSGKARTDQPLVRVIVALAEMAVPTSQAWVELGGDDTQSMPSPGRSFDG